MAEARLAAQETFVCGHFHMAEARLAAQMVRSCHEVARRNLGLCRSIDVRSIARSCGAFRMAQRDRAKV
jgi:hypothetical protein